MWLLSYEARNTSGVTRNLANACGHSRVVASAFSQATASRNSTNSAGTMAIQYRPCRRARRPCPVIRVVGECVRDVHGADVIRRLRLSFDPAEVQPPVADDVAHRVVAADLPLQQLRRQLLAVVPDLAGLLLQPLEPIFDPVLRHEVRPADDLKLIDMLHVDAELPAPLIQRALR